MSLLSLTVNTPQTHASGSNGFPYEGQEAEASSKRSAGRPPCDESRRLTCSGSGALLPVNYATASSK
ncbi:hypothetical protein XFF6994_2870004 [Xanthomonas citri pv. fuscans]|nr:hypothetical protein XFF6994_2870004 [Xanthomonas citri pv. fuscans]